MPAEFALQTFDDANEQDHESQFMACLKLDPRPGTKAQSKGPRLDVPRRGHVLSTAAEKYGRPLREAVAVLSGSLATRPQCARVYEEVFGVSCWQPIPNVVRPQTELAAWAIVSMWAVGVASEYLDLRASLAEADEWFCGLASARVTKLPSEQAVKTAETLLHSKADASAYRELLPYILDPHGPGSRLSIRHNPETRATRVRKRTEGVFYTPADVAEFMAASSLDFFDCSEPVTILDPACGTGVFLRAALKELCRRHPNSRASELASKCLFGVDIDPWPLNAAAFVLLADSWKDSSDDCLSPAALWRRLRLNFACVDTLRLDPAQGGGFQPAGSSVADEPVGRPTDSNEEQHEKARVRLSQLFPALKHGVRVILGNPPYADLGRRPDFASLGRAFRTISAKPHPNAELYLPFVEQMTRLTAQESCAGALVLPLSIACNIGQQFTAARKLISETPGTWRFAFFDREPHALFGEDVKTRNTILLWSRKSSDQKSTLATGPLQKWRGDKRAAMFRSLRFTAIDSDIHPGIPKVDGSCQAAALKTLGDRWTRLEDVVHSIVRLKLCETPHADDRTVFVGPTAYNFLNVFLKPSGDLLATRHQLSEHPLHAIHCASYQDTLAVFAILTSHLAYWWWHAHGDGFHVPKRFVASLPFGHEALAADIRTKLSACGADLWSKIKTKPVVSLNRNRASLAYTPNGYDDLRKKADYILADIAGLEETFVDELQRFTTHTVAATLRVPDTPNDQERA